MRGAGDGEGGGRRRDFRRGGHYRGMADTASVGILRERKGGEDELTQKRGRSSRKGPDASHSQVVDKGGWDREKKVRRRVLSGRLIAGAGIEDQ